MTWAACPESIHRLSRPGLACLRPHLLPPVEGRGIGGRQRRNAAPSAIAVKPAGPALVIGSGKTPVLGGRHPLGLKLVDGKVSTSGAVIGTYEPAGKIAAGSFALD